MGHRPLPARRREREAARPGGDRLRLGGRIVERGGPCASIGRPRHQHGLGRRCQGLLRPDVDDIVRPGTFQDLRRLCPAGAPPAGPGRPLGTARPCRRGLRRGRRHRLRANRVPGVPHGQGSHRSRPGTCSAGGGDGLAPHRHRRAPGQHGQPALVVVLRRLLGPFVETADHRRHGGRGGLVLPGHRVGTLGGLVRASGPGARLGLTPASRARRHRRARCGPRLPGRRPFGVGGQVVHPRRPPRHRAGLRGEGWAVQLRRHEGRRLADVSQRHGRRRPRGRHRLRHRRCRSDGTGPGRPLLHCRRDRVLGRLFRGPHLAAGGQRLVGDERFGRGQPVPGRPPAPAHQHRDGGGRPLGPSPPGRGPALPSWAHRCRAGTTGAPARPQRDGRRRRLRRAVPPHLGGRFPGRQLALGGPGVAGPAGKRSSSAEASPNRECRYGGGALVASLP